MHFLMTSCQETSFYASYHRSPTVVK